jgi:hypothetical protein
MYHELQGFKYIFKISKRFLKKFNNSISLYIKIVISCIIKLWCDFNVSLVTLTCYTLKEKEEGVFQCIKPIIKNPRGTN